MKNIFWVALALLALFSQEVFAQSQPPVESNFPSYRPPSVSGWVTSYSGINPIANASDAIGGIMYAETHGTCGTGSYIESITWIGNPPPSEGAPYFEVKVYCPDGHGSYDGIYHPQYYRLDRLYPQYANGVSCPNPAGGDYDPTHYPNGCNSSLAANPGNNKGPCITCEAKALIAAIFGDPINAGTGNKFETKTEYRGTGPFPLEFTWTYNSAGASGIDTPLDATLGSNRTSNYDRHIRAYTDGATTIAYISRPDGRTLQFTRSGSIWVTGSDLDGALTSTRDGNDVVTGWAYRNAQNETEAFDANGALLSITNANGFAQTLTYDSSKRIASVSDMTGRQLLFAYNTSNHLTQVTLPDGGALVFAYDVNDNLQAVTYPGGTSTSYFYNEQAYTNNTSLLHALTGEQDEKGGTNPRYSTTIYDTKGRATASFLATNIDRYDAVYTDSSDGSYVATAAITSPLNKTRTLVFQTVQGRVVPSGYVDSCPGCTSQTKAFNYTTSGHVSSSSDYAGVVTTYTQDANGLETQRIESSNQAATKRTIQTTWDAGLRVPTYRYLYDSSASQPGVMKAKQAWLYNTRGQVTFQSIIDPANANNYRRVGYTYCESADVIAGTCQFVGLVTIVNGARTDVTDYTWFTYYPSNDANCPTTCTHRKGDLWKVKNAKLQETIYLTYDGAGRPLKIQDPNGVITQFIYSSRGWLTQVIVHGIVDSNSIGADDAITTIAYEATGKVSKVTLPDGDFLSYTYDAAHRLTDVTDNIGRSIHYTLDNAGNHIKEDSKNSTGTIKRTLSRVYDQLGRVKQTLNAAGLATSFAYDANDNIDQATDPLGHTTDQDVDALNRVKQTTQDWGFLNVLTKVQYDSLDQVTQVTDPKNLNTTYTYNGLGDLITRVSPDTGTTSYTYDSAGDRASQTDARGVTATYGYDVLNRLTSVSYPTSALNATYAYDTVNAACLSGESYPKGRLTKFTDPSGNTQFCYDRFGNLTRKVQTNSTGTLIQTTNFEYTLGGRLYRVTYPSGAQALYTRNTFDQITGVQLTIAGVTSTLVSSTNYMPFGPLNVLTFGNGHGQLRVYDQDYNPDLFADSATDGFGADYAVDAIGNITSTGESFKGVATTRNYSYDNLNRLTLATTPSATTLDERFTYDGTGDRQSKQIGATGFPLPYVYPSTSHQLSSMFGQPRSYDAAGNTTQIGPSTANYGYVYDDRGRLTDVKTTGTTVRSYQYNGRGERVAKLFPGAPSNNLVFDYDEAGHLLGEYTSAGARVAEYVWLDDTLVGIIKAQEGTTFQYVETDHLGTPRVVINPVTNTTIWHWDLSTRSFGENAPNADPDGNGVSYTLNLRFPGQYFDDVGGMNYNYYRDYEPGTGRYAESDPIGLGGGVSTYGYVGANPTFRRDSRGLDWSGTVVTLGGGEVFGGAHYSFDLRGECWKGFRWHLKVNAVAFGAEIGFPQIPVNGVYQEVVLQDWIHAKDFDNDPELFDRLPDSEFQDAMFNSIGAGVVFGDGHSADFFQFDKFIHVESKSTGNDFGYDIGAHLFLGQSVIGDVAKKEKCSCGG